MLFRHSDNLSRTLQKKEYSAVEGQMAADKTITTLQKIRKEDSFNGFWEKVVEFSSDKDVDDPVLPRRRKQPRRFEEGSVSHEYDSCLKICTVEFTTKHWIS